MTSAAASIPVARAEAAGTPIRDARISRILPGVKALDGVDIALYPGEVTALIGENGAGKSTLVKILTGIYRPNEGEIVMDGKPVTFANAQAAIDAGVTAIHQETVLFDELTVAETISRPCAAHALRPHRSEDHQRRLRADAPVARISTRRSS